MSPNACSEAVFESELGAHIFRLPVQSFVDSSMLLTFSSISIYNSDHFCELSPCRYNIQHFTHYLI